MTRERIPQRLLDWIDARRRHRLSDAQVQMARELGMNPTKLGKLDNHGQEPWKLPLPAYIEHLYAQRFGRRHPDIAISIEETQQLDDRNRAARRQARRARRKPPE